MAFQKAYRLPRTYVFNTVTTGANLTRPRSSDRATRCPATHIEVDKRRQILMVVKNGKVHGLICVSTGATGNTPEGTLRIQQKHPYTAPDSRRHPVPHHGLLGAPSTGTPPYRRTPRATGACASRCGSPPGSTISRGSASASTSTAETVDARVSGYVRRASAGARAPRAAPGWPVASTRARRERCEGERLDREARLHEIDGGEQLSQGEAARRREGDAGRGGGVEDVDVDVQVGTAGAAPRPSFVRGASSSSAGSQCVAEPARRSTALPLTTITRDADRAAASPGSRSLPPACSARRSSSAAPPRRFQRVG